VSSQRIRKPGKWNCFRSGHQPMDLGQAPDIVQIQEELWAGGICKHCHVVFYSKVGQASSLVNSSGQKVVLS
jgi:hypothetical protein